MSIVIDIPEEMQRQLREGSELPLDRLTLEAAAVEWYRQGKLFHSQFAKLLGISRYDADGVLKRYGVVDEYTYEEIVAHVNYMDQLRQRNQE
ncbi:MAG: UPF0175 family protein [Burkholderiales bacterium]|nr:UPF0175 family protein [Phycisphaerae bacterium]